MPRLHNADRCRHCSTLCRCVSGLCRYWAMVCDSNACLGYASTMRTVSLPCRCSSLHSHALPPHRDAGLCPCKGLHISAITQLICSTPCHRLALLRRGVSTLFGSSAVPCRAVPSPRFALPIPSLPCRYITVLRFAHPPRVHSAQCRCRAYLCKSIASLCQACASLFLANPMRLLTKPSLYETVRCQAISTALRFTA
jgi:hypothetical protein